MEYKIHPTVSIYIVRSEIETLVKSSPTHIMLNLDELEILGLRELGILFFAFRTSREYKMKIALSGLKDTFKAILEISEISRHSTDIVF